MRAGGGAEQPAPSRSPQNTVKNQKFFFDFRKVHNELGKVTKFGTSRTLFSWRNGLLKIVRADSSPPRPNRVNLPVCSSMIVIDFESKISKVLNYALGKLFNYNSLEIVKILY